MRASYRICLGLIASFAAGLWGCKNFDECEDPGAIEACACGDATGARICQPEYIWADCDCSAGVPDGGATGGMGGMMATGGMMASGGSGGMPADSGTDSGPGEEPGYVACTAAAVATDCGAGAQCRESDELLLGGSLFVCAPACTAPADCPPAPAGGEATVECADGFCVLSCSTDFLAPVACPTGMTCATKTGVDTCYAD